MSSKPASMKIAAALGAQFDVHLEVGEELGHLGVGPLDALAARFAQAVRVLLVGDVDAPARLADAEQFLEDQFRPVEDLQGMAAGDEVELVVLEDHLGGIAIDILDVGHAEIGRDLAGIVEARARMVERQQARGLEFLLHQHREIADAAADVGHLHAGLQPVLRQQLALMAPGQAGLDAQDRNEAAFLQEGLAGIEVLVIFVDGHVAAARRASCWNLRVDQPMTLDVTTSMRRSGRRSQASASRPAMARKAMLLSRASRFTLR